MSRFPWQKSSPGRENHELHREWGKDSIFQGFITVINSSKSYWRIDPASLPPFVAGARGGRRIKRGPLIDLDALQSLLKSGNFDDDKLDLANPDCIKDMQKEGWSSTDVLNMLAGLCEKNDYYKSEWCAIHGSRMVPCDVYRTPFDAARGCRTPKGLLVYIKFSIEEDGGLTIALVSCHAA